MYVSSLKKSSVCGLYKVTAAALMWDVTPCQKKSHTFGLAIVTETETLKCDVSCAVSADFFFFFVNLTFKCLFFFFVKICQCICPSFESAP